VDLPVELALVLAAVHASIIARDQPFWYSTAPVVGVLKAAQQTMASHASPYGLDRALPDVDQNQQDHQRRGPSDCSGATECAAAAAFAWGEERRTGAPLPGRFSLSAALASV